MISIQKQADILHKKIAAFGVPKTKIVKKVLKKRPTLLSYEYDTLKVKDGKTPIRGKDYFTATDIEEIKNAVHARVKDEIKPVDEDSIVTRILDELRGKLSINDLKDVNEFTRRTRDGLVTRYKIEEMMHGGGGASSAANSAYNEVVSGSGTIWTLANPPVVNTLRLYVNGQRLTPTVDYTLSGINVTTVDSWVAGTLLADYTY